MNQAAAGPPCRNRYHHAVDPAKYRDLAEHPVAVGATPQVQHDLDRRGELAVQGLATQPAQCAQCLQAGWQFRGTVRVHGAGATLVAGVQRGQQFDHLAAPYLAHDQSVRPHP